MQGSASGSISEAVSPVAVTAAHSSERSDTACDTLYYDGQCPLCASEISKLREARSDDLRLVDIHDRAALPVANDTSAPDKDRLLRTLHLQRADGSWLIGADANVAAWEGTSQQKLLRPLRWPLLRHVVDLGYSLWAKWRYWRLYGARFDEEKHAPDQG